MASDVGYTVVKKLGEGATGTVYLVEDKEGAQYALKSISRSRMKRTGRVRRAMTERDILLSVSHPLILHVKECYTTEHHLNIVTEYCSGGSLYEHFPLDRAQAVRYAAETLLALEYLHSVGIVYRDIKPENILVHESGHIRLADFDLSRRGLPVEVSQVEDELKVEPCLVTRSFVGTPEYIAPEVIAGTYGAEVDYWSFGILLYEMLYNTTPFKGTDVDDTFRRIRKGKVKWPEYSHKDERELIGGLLTLDVKKRWTCSRIKKSKFFRTINWPLILS